ncbi:hypothetical protein H0H87_007732 [Tephrocybe sp. NHM501043]|nr:hypothetical protein H0H87_007732 [Tephrocybe sp. NHM501043]
MTGLVLTIDDGDPLITYQPPGAWAQHNDSTDSTVANNFYGRTWMVTRTPGATMSITFEGVNIAVYGSMSPEHGNYTTNIDGIVGFGDGQTTEPTMYNAKVYVSNTLSPTTHTLTILNQHTDILDIDYITWTSKVDTNKNGTLSRVVKDDFDSAFKYFGTWSTASDNLSDFYSNTGHSTLLTGFQGDAVSLYGTIGPSNGPYTIQLDNQVPKAYVATATTYATQSLLFYGSNLGAGNHTLVVSNTGNALLEIDYAEVFELPLFLSNATSTTSTNTLETSATNTKHVSRLSVGAIAGIAVGAAVTILLLALISFCLCLAFWKRRWFREQGATAGRALHEYPGTSPEESATVSPFRLSQHSRSTFDSPIETPLSETRKPPIRNFGPIGPSQPPAPSTLGGEDGSNLQIPRHKT